MSEFDNIEGLDGWTNKLGELLDDAEAAARATDIETRLTMNRRLTEFIVNSRPNTPEILALDTIAEQTRAALMRLTIDERLADLNARTGEYARLSKEFEARAEANQASASTLRLAGATRVVDALTSSIREISQLKGLLLDGSEEDLSRSLERLISAMQRARNDVEGVA